ncbi:MAG: hypothetical protein ACTIBK_03345 [Glutamicibacter arilaitensis]|uniref:hypothetical protein n=1 Tax=Glutamicibacter arilaitensis TaxID=256701 RepID=UPI003F912421
MKPSSVGAASAPQEVVWWDRLLIRLPGYSLFAWMGAYGMYQAGYVTLGSAVLLFFTVALPLLAGWQVFQVMRSHKRVQAWRSSQRITQGNLGVPNVPEIRAKLEQIRTSGLYRPEPQKPRFGSLAIFCIILAVAALGITVGILLAKLGIVALTAFAIVGLLMAAIRPLQLMGVQNRAYRAVASISEKLREVRELVVQERQLSSRQRTTQAVNSVLDMSLQIIDMAIDHSKSGYFRASVDCVDLLDLLAQECWLGGSKPQNLVEKLRGRVNAALSQLHIEERNSLR